MKRWIVTQLGDPSDALQLVDIDLGELKPGEVKVKVEAAAMNFFDILQCQGKYQEKYELPFTPGAEVAGVIEEVTEGSKFKVGEHVIVTSRPPEGGFSQYVHVPEGKIFPIPKELPFEEAAGFYITHHTGYYGLKNRGQLKEGEILLVHAGAGGVGSAAIQLGKALGATVIATAGSDEKVAVCKAHGADYAINYNTEDFVQVVKEITKNRGADVIYDSVGGDVFQKSRKCIAFDGRILTIGYASGEMPTTPINHILVKNYSIVGVHFGLFAHLYPEQVNEAHEELMRLYVAGKLKPLVYKTYAMDELPKALGELGSRRTYGKLILKPWVSSAVTDAV